jgi:hypothetical protein
VVVHVEESLARQVLDYFDLIVGTSTGGIIVLALGLGFGARDAWDSPCSIGRRSFMATRGFEPFVAGFMRNTIHVTPLGFGGGIRAARSGKREAAEHRRGRFRWQDGVM